MGTIIGSCSGKPSTVCFGKIMVREIRRSKIPPAMLIIWPVIPIKVRMLWPKKPNERRIKRAITISLNKINFCLLALNGFKIAM